MIGNEPLATTARQNAKNFVEGYLSVAAAITAIPERSIQHPHCADLAPRGVLFLEQHPCRALKSNVIGRPRFGGASMALNLLRSGYATLEYEIAQERASAFGRLGRRLEAALAALAACPRTANSDRKTRDGIVKQAGYALWLFIVQPEACGLNDSHPSAAELRGAERGLCPHGALPRPSIEPNKTTGA